MTTPKRFFYEPRIDGKRLFFSFATKREKQEFIRDFEKQRREQRLGIRSQIMADPLEEFAKKWLFHQRERVELKDLTFSAWKVFELHLRKHILPEIGHIHVDQFNVPLFNEFIHNLRMKGVGASTANRIRSTLHSVFSEVAVKGYLPANPLTMVKRLEERPVPRKILETTKDIETWLNEALVLGPKWFAMEMILLNTGMRKSNLIALKWSDFDFASKTLTVQRLWEQASRTIVDRTKGSPAYTIGLNDALTWAVTEWRKLTPHPADTDFVLTAEDGSYLDSKTVDYYHNKIRTKTGFDVVVHGARHTYGSHLSVSGSLEAAREQLGHKDQSTTERFYKKQIKDQLSVRANAVNFLPTTEENP